MDETTGMPDQENQGMPENDEMSEEERRRQQENNPTGSGNESTPESGSENNQ